MKGNFEWKSEGILTIALAKHLKTDADQPPLKASITSRETSNRIGDEVPDFPTGTCTVIVHQSRDKKPHPLTTKSTRRDHSQQLLQTSSSNFCGRENATSQK